MLLTVRRGRLRKLAGLCDYLVIDSQSAVEVSSAALDLPALIGPQVLFPPFSFGLAHQV